MRANTKKRKKATVMLKATQEQEWWADQVVQVMLHGKRALDAAMLDVGRLVAETLMYMEREERSGPDYHPTSSGLMKWASQRGSIYVGDQKLCVEHPRLRGPEGEVVLRTYEQLKNRGGFSEELLSKVLRGMSSRKYEETVTEAGKAFGVTPSSVSRHLVEATAKQLKQFRERSLEEFPVFAMYLDTVHRGGQAFVVALGVDREGKKLPLGFWEGATENHEICEELLEELERRGLKLSKQVIWVTDGGGGIIKALKGRYGKKLIHQRCTLHKDRNIQRHLPKRYRKRATPPLRDRLGAEQLQGREEDVAGVRALASRHQRVGGGFTPRSARGSADPPQAKGPRSAAQEPCIRRIPSRACSRWFAVASATSNAIGTAKCASAGSPRCYCTANAGSDESRATHPLTQSSQHRCDPTRDRNARGRVSSGRKSGT